MGEEDKETVLWFHAMVLEREGRVLGGISPTPAAAGIMPWKPSGEIVSELWFKRQA